MRGCWAVGKRKSDEVYPVGASHSMGSSGCREPEPVAASAQCSVEAHSRARG